MSTSSPDSTSAGPAPIERRRSSSLAMPPSSRSTISASRSPCETTTPSEWRSRSSPERLYPRCALALPRDVRDEHHDSERHAIDDERREAARPDDAQQPPHGEVAADR